MKEEPARSTLAELEQYCESLLNNLRDVRQSPQLSAWPDILDALDELITGTEAYSRYLDERSMTELELAQCFHQLSESANEVLRTCRLALLPTRGSVAH